MAAAFLAAAFLGSCASSSYDFADTNNDTKMSPEEFDRYMLEAIFAEADPNGDSKVTFAEWRAANPDGDTTKFNRPDTNRDGVVTPAEVKAHFDKEGTMDDLFAKMDTDGDGNLTQSEIAAFKEKLEAQSPGSTPLQKLSQAVKE